MFTFGQLVEAGQAKGHSPVRTVDALRQYERFDIVVARGDVIKKTEPTPSC